MNPVADVAIIGGTGLYALLPDGHSHAIHTPYGLPSSAITVQEMNGCRVAFLARHGPHHEYPAHRVPYRANMWALASMGVTRVLAPCAAGSLRGEIHPGAFVIPDQIIDRTYGRDATFYDDAAVHVAFADPYCPQLRTVVAARINDSVVDGHSEGTIVVVAGPRFGTRAEAAWHRQAGGDLVNMTAMPEAVLARELGLCYCNIAVVTDYDAGLDGQSPVTQQAVHERFDASIETLRAILLQTALDVPSERACACASGLDATMRRES